MSFYVQLPSNCDNPSGRNTTTKFITNFQTRLPLIESQKYEVGLVESIYTQSWTVAVGYLYYGYLKSMERKGEKDVPVIAFDNISIMFHDGDNIEKFISRINDRIEFSIIEKIYNQKFNLMLVLKKRNPKIIINTDIYPNKEFSIHDENNIKLINTIKDGSEFKNAPKIIYKENQLYIKFYDKYQSIQFFGRVNTILKTLFNRETMISSKLIGSKNELNYQLLSQKETLNLFSPIFLLGTFYIYTDILENQYVGNTRAPLLKTVVINYNSSQSISWNHYDNPQYLDVNKTEINSILIDIRDEFGEKILFEEGTFTVKLHFRPKNVF